MSQKNVGQSKTKKPSTATEVFAEGSHFEIEITERIRKSEKVAWRVAGVGIGFAVIFGLANFYLVVRPSPPPQVIEVEKQTGRVQLLTSLDHENMPVSQANDEHWAQQYVLYRLSYIPGVMETFYEYVTAMSDSAETDVYTNWYSPQNPASPMNVYKDGRMKITITSVSPLNKGESLLILYTKQFITAGGRSEPEPWQVVLSYKYEKGAKISKQARWINPFGWQCTAFHESPQGAVNNKTMERVGK